MHSVQDDHDGALGPAAKAYPELVGRYVGEWGAPCAQAQLAHAANNGAFHVMAFDHSPVARVVTVGLGACHAADAAPLGLELLVVIGRPELHEIGVGRVQDFVGDIGAHLLRFANRPTDGSVMPRTSIAPWQPDALVFDSPRGESEAIEQFVADGWPLRLVWAIPVYEEEAALVQQRGIKALDELVEQANVSLADIHRPNFL